MNFDDIKSMWNNDEGEGAVVPNSVDQLKTLSLPIEKIRKNMRLEFYIQLITMVLIGFLPTFGYIGQLAVVPFFIIYFVAVIITIYYFSRFHIFYKQLNTNLLRSKDHLYELYYEGKLNVEMYKSFAYTLIPLFFMGEGLHLMSIYGARTRELLQMAQTHQWKAALLIGTFLFLVLVTMLGTNLWAKAYYGRHLDQIKMVLNEFKENA
ncbi:MAG: hypothetical protein J7623_05090 [Chitinophaga sp.]|uniref:hypothetical protein n=1 Tax=Chitinophaga sp. TaxID=1869181 RepID=UPI001B034422|nr:hypothetical protein [Chitinophaga sp.]MBO9727994.1 hypothetical protein [Chitinophaga sp.]